MQSDVDLIDLHVQPALASTRARRQERPRRARQFGYNDKRRVWHPGNMTEHDGRAGGDEGRVEHQHFRPVGSAGTQDRQRRTDCAGRRYNIPRRPYATTTARYRETVAPQALASSGIPTFRHSQGCGNLPRVSRGHHRVSLARGCGMEEGAIASEYRSPMR